MIIINSALKHRFDYQLNLIKSLYPRIEFGFLQSEFVVEKMLIPSNHFKQFREPTHTVKSRLRFLEPILSISFDSLKRSIPPKAHPLSTNQCSKRKINTEAHFKLGNRAMLDESFGASFCRHECNFQLSHSVQNRMNNVGYAREPPLADFRL